MLTLIIARDELTQTNFFDLYRRGRGIAWSLMRPAQWSSQSVRDPAGEFYELGGLANDEYQCAPSFTRTGGGASGAKG
jgi:hypothetical protein